MSTSLMKPARVWVAALLTSVSLGVSGCSGPDSGEQAGPNTAPRVPLSQVKATGDPKTLEGPSTATLANDEVEPVMQNPAQKLPTTVISHDRGQDRKVTIKDASRVVAVNVSGSLAATVSGLGLGKSLVARDQSTTFPSAKKLPVITSGGHAVNAEALLATKPTLVITDGSVGPRDVVEQLRSAGVTVVFVKNDPSFAGAAQLAKDVAGVLGVPQAGEKLANQISSEVKATRAEVARLAPSEPGRKLRVIFLYVRGHSGIYYLFGKGSGAEDLISGLDATDIATVQGWSGMKPATDEAIAKANPDVVLMMTDGLKSAGGVDGLLQSHPSLALTNAGKHKRFVDMSDGAILSFGPRSGDVIDALARAVYAPTKS